MSFLHTYKTYFGWNTLLKGILHNTGPLNAGLPCFSLWDLPPHPQPVEFLNLYTSTPDSFFPVTFTTTIIPRSPQQLLWSDLKTSQNCILMPRKMADNTVIHTLLAGSVSQGSVRLDDFSSNTVLKYCFLSAAASHHSLHTTFPRLVTFYCRIPGSRWAWGRVSVIASQHSILEGEGASRGPN